MKLNNVKSKLIAIMIIVMLVIIELSFIGCDNTNNSVKASDDMFVTVSEGRLYDVLYDKDTKVMYVNSYRGVFAMLVNADGTPKLYKGQ